MELPSLPTFRVFLERLATEYNTELFDAALDPHPPGYPTRGQHLTRRWKEGRIFVLVPARLALDKEMLPVVLRMLCAGLEIDPKDFGLILH